MSNEKKNIDKINKKKRNTFIKEWVLPVFAALGLAILINKFLIFNVYIPSTSMAPTINVGDRLMVNRVFHKDNIKRGDILVFYSDELQETLIKRVIGLPGDHIVIKDGVVNVNEDDLEEDYVKNNREIFDVAIARAVANLSILAELCIPLVKKDKYFIAMKAEKGLQELSEAENAVEILGCKIFKVDEYMLNNSKRVNLVYKKVRNTPLMYPRHYSKIKKSPL